MENIVKPYSRLFKQFVFYIVCVFLSLSCSLKKNYSSNSKIDNEETIVLYQPGTNIVWPITGKIYNSIDPRYIANTNGFTLSVRTDNKRKITEKTFELISISGSPTLGSEYSSSNITSSVSWNYYINDKLMPYYSRILTTALMPQAIEAVEFIKNDSLKIVLVPDAKLSDKIEQGAAAIKIYTRNFSRNSISKNSSIYLLNNIIITPKIFEALDPVFIKSLERTTNKKELAIYEKKGLEEIVKIELFTLREVLSSFTADGGNAVLLIDNVELPLDTEKMLKKYFFKEVKHISAEDEEFSVYERRHPGKDYFIIISL